MSGAEGFVLELLPARGLDQSMLLPVLIGLFVVLFFTETLGWVFAGAVVPGYLASVLIIQPVTGAIVIFESLASLAIAALLANTVSRTGVWTRFFGRERFFLILAVSLIVRIHDHAWFAPWAIARLDGALGTALETQQDFYSVGLVLVPLTANMLWKPAVNRGIMQLGIQVGITYLIVALVVLPYTNLSLSSMALTYENASINFVGHAKAHIILLTAALLAAQFNLTYGWDFNGILVPALLAMLWLTPLKLVATVGEAVVVLILVRGFLRLPVIRHLDFAGPRKVVLVFTLAFAWKLALGFALAPIFPELKISDTYGFGYLLSSLLAVKMLGLNSVRAVLLPALTASAGGFMIGSVAAFLLDIAAPQLPPQHPIERPASQRLVSTPLGVATLARMQIEVQREQPPAPTQAELRQLQLFWAELARLDQARAQALHERVPDELPRLLASIVRELEGGLELSALGRVRRRGAALGLQIVELGSHPVGPEPSSSDPLAEFDDAPVRVDRRARREWFGIVEQGGGARRGFTTGVVIPGARGPVLVVPMPVSEAPITEAATLACRRVDCRAVLIAGHEQQQPGTRIRPRPVEIAVAAFAAEHVVVMRAEPRSVTAPTRIHPLGGHFALVDLWPDYELDWSPRETLIRPPPGKRSFVLLSASPTELEAMLIAGAHEFNGAEPAAPARRSTEAELLAVVAEIQAKVEPPGLAGSSYEPPSDAELLLLEREIVEPLVDWAQRSGPGVEPPPLVALWAASLDYELVEFGDCRGINANGTYRPCLVMLRERERPSTAGWGTLVVRRDPRALRVTVEIPRPHRELRTAQVGAELWQLSRAAELVIAGADGRVREPAPGDGLRRAPNPDPARPGNLGTPFQAIHQGIDRSAVRGRAREVVQIRGLTSYRTIDVDLILGLGQPGKAEQDDQACWAELDEQLAALVSTWGRCRIADGSEDLYLLSGAGSPQLEYSRELRSREVRVLWLSAGLRERFADDRGLIELRGLRQAGFEPEPRREIEVLLAPLWPADPQPKSKSKSGRVTLGEPGFTAAVELALEFSETGNLHLLRELRALHERGLDLRVEAGVGQDWGRPFLLIERAGGGLGERALVSLDHALDGRVELSAAELGGDAVARLQVAGLGRPQLLILRDLQVVGAQP